MTKAQVEVITSVQRRRRWSTAEKERIVAAAIIAIAGDVFGDRDRVCDRSPDAHGLLCLSNNAAERALRGIAVGRHNWTFAGSDEGARRAAAVYTLIETAKLNGIDPRAWLADILARLPYESSRSAFYEASRVRFVHIPAGAREADFHNPPGRLLAIWLDGEVEFETSDGEMRRVSAGKAVLVEDTHGKGHISRHPPEGQNVI